MECKYEDVAGGVPIISTSTRGFQHERTNGKV
jgi:hypothetical protein